MILLSFDIEEFDMPIEFGHAISFDDQIRISEEGTLAILDLLRKHAVTATFFCTANFAMHSRHVMDRIVKEGHEVASHGYYHSDFKIEHLATSKKLLEEITGMTISGYRMARMMPFDESKLSEAGYRYNSSLNPTYLPGRYNNFLKPRTLFSQHGIIQFPASVTPVIRFPLFWLSFHNLPLWVYKKLCQWTHSKDGYLNIYFHPWEFTDLTIIKAFPSYVTKNGGKDMIARMDAFICWGKKKGISFGRCIDFLNDRRLLSTEKSN